MANHTTKSNRPKIGDLKILAILTTLRLDVAADYRRYIKEKQESKPNPFDILQNARFSIALDTENDEMRILLLVHQIAPLAFYTKQGAQDSIDRHEKEWRQLLRTLTPAERSDND